MRSYLWAVGLSTCFATVAAAQLLENPAAKPTDKRPVGDAEANAKANDGLAPGGPALRGSAPQGHNPLFAAMDTDSDGIISKAELRKAIKALKTLDTDNDGNITLAEASVGGAIGPGGPLGENPQIAQWMANDRNNDGKLTPNEVPNELLPMLRGVDQNGDGAIDRQELTAAVGNMRNQFGNAGGPWPRAGGPRAGEQATGQFLQYDRNGDGKLTQDEIPQQATRALQGADSNGDGAIDAGELQAAMARMGDGARALRGGVDPGNLRGRGVGRDRNPPNN